MNSSIVPISALLDDESGLRVYEEVTIPVWDYNVVVYAAGPITKLCVRAGGGDSGDMR